MALLTGSDRPRVRNAKSGSAKKMNIERPTSNLEFYALERSGRKNIFLSQSRRDHREVKVSLDWPKEGK